MHHLIDSSAVQALIALAVEEDLSLGDPTTELSVTADASGKAQIVAREHLVFCGGDIAGYIFESYGNDIQFERTIADGTEVAANTVLLEAVGPLRDLLSLERLTLNFMQRLSGIASNTRRIVSLANSLKVLDTRKTTPGWRTLEKYAIRCGGGSNHRHNLGDMILVKDNHIDANGGDIKKTLERIFAGKSHYIPVEVEVRTPDEAKQALQFDVNSLLLDNMDDETISETLALVASIKPEVQCEVSGGITPERFAELEARGVTLVSLGAPSTKAQFVDIAMDVVG